MGDLLGSPRVAPPFSFSFSFLSASLPFFPISINCGRDVNALASTRDTLSYFLNFPSLHERYYIEGAHRAGGRRRLCEGM